MNSRNGFTLIELLVVISIIGLLSSIVLVALGTARTKAYDAQRLANLINIQTALEIYYAANGIYPTTTGNINSVCTGGIYTGVAANLVINGLTPTYIAAIPTDSQMDSAGGKCCYSYQSNDGKDYKFMFYSCIAGSVACTGAAGAEPNLPNPGRANSCAVYSSGARLW